MKLLSFKIASAHVDYNFGGTLSLGVQARLPWWDDGQTPPVIRIDGSLTAWLNIPHLMFNAEGNVRSVRMPDQKKDAKKDASSGMLSQDEPLHDVRPAGKVACLSLRRAASAEG